MSPQKFVKTLPPGFTEVTPPKTFQFLVSQDDGFVVAYGIPQESMKFQSYTPEKKLRFVYQMVGLLFLPLKEKKRNRQFVFKN